MGEHNPAAAFRENKTNSNQKHIELAVDAATTAGERHDRVSPFWRRFYNDHCWPAWRLDRCSLDELLRLQKAVPYLQSAIDRAVSRKELAR